MSGQLSCRELEWKGCKEGRIGEDVFRHDNITSCGRLWKVVEGCGMLWKVVKGCGRLWKVVEKCERLWKVVEGCERFGRLGKIVERCGRLGNVVEGRHVVKVCNVLESVVKLVVKGLLKIFEML